MNKADRIYFEALAERDCLRYCIEQMYEDVKHRSPLDKMIDASTGYEASLTDEAKKMMARMDELTKIIEES